ncbi:integral membrane protein [Talaromyces proteolyticus]|uniref:Integral membrane protein n=1 Tax=Talaromyces proteolyticus TaxID=1131652 RepID=A0AAD4KQC5_9EURO|nr:uncharacterized protein BGW36DRAFT_397645 [Talaromyces proteolyticus]KAH8696002.1 integral membrane protein [Talaromyces proteolyticus]
MSDEAPLDYSVPPFPSLHLPVIGVPQAQNYLYHAEDIWRFTLYWTLILHIGLHFVVAAFATAIQWRNWRMMWAVPVAYVVVSGLEALLAGSMVGLILGWVYEAGNFTMTTWIPLVWAGINVLVVIISSFPMQSAI